MKKLSILLIGLLLVAGFAFGQEVTVAGDATITFGYDLDSSTSGFMNEASSSIELAWLSGDEASGTQGWITLSGWSIGFDDDGVFVATAADVSAGWTFDPVTVTIYSAPDLSAGNASGFAYLGLDEEDARDVQAVALANKNVATAAGAGSFEGLVVATADVQATDIIIDATSYAPFAVIVLRPVAGDAEVATSYQGLTVSVDLGVASVDLMLASDGTWENSDNDYAVGAVISADIAPVAVNAGVFAGPFDAMDLGFTVGVSGAFGPATVAVGFDGWMADGATDLGYDVSVDIGAGFAGVTVGSLSYLYLVGTDMELDQEVTLDASGVVEGLGFTETFQMVNVLVGTLAWYSETAVSYATGGIMPYATFGIDDASIIDLTAGVELSGFVENTVFTIEYDVDDVTNGNKGLITAAGTISF